ncbi:MAG: CHAT domain-containing protein [Chloroflexota bacterium]
MLTEYYQHYVDTGSLQFLASIEDPIAIFDELKQKIVSALQHGHLEESQKWEQFAWTIAHETEDDDHIAQANWCSAIFYGYRNFRRSADHQKKAIDHFQLTKQDYNEGRALIGYATQLNLLGQFEEAERALKRAEICLQPYPDYQDWPAIYLNLSLIYIDQGRYPEAISSTEQTELAAIAFATKDPSQSAYYDIYIAEALVNRGIAATLCYNKDLIHTSLKDAITLAEQHQVSDIADRARLSLGIVLTLEGDLFESLRVLRDTHQSFDSIQNQTMVACVLQHEAEVYSRLKMPMHARNATVRAAQVFEKEKVVFEGVETYLAAVSIALHQNKIKRAKHYLNTSKSLATHTAQPLQLLWQCYNTYLSPKETSKEYRGALSEIDEAAKQLIQLGTIQHGLTAYLLAASLAGQLQRQDTIERYEAIAQESQENGFIHLAQDAYIEMAKYQLPHAAQKSLKRAAEILVHTRQRMPVAELKANLWTGQADLYAKLIEAQFACDQQDDALQTLFEAKGGIWTDFTSTNLKREPNEALIRTRAQLTYWQDELRQANQQENPEHLNYQEQCEKHIERAKSELATMMLNYTLDITNDQEQPNYSLPSLATIQTQLKAGQNTTAQQMSTPLSTQPVILDYFVGTENIYACIIPAVGNPHWIKLGKVTDVTNLMTKLDMLIATIMGTSNRDKRQKVIDKQKTTTEEVLSKLYKELMEPIKEYFTYCEYNPHKLLIAPDRSLFSIPWSALYDGDAYLSDYFQIMLYPSPVLLALSDGQSYSTGEDAADKISFIFGYVGDPPLNHIVQELLQIEKTLSNTRKIESAQKADFKWSNPPRCLHIAAHGEVDSNAPLLSKLEIANDPLFLADILDLNLKGTELVTLSACVTGVMPELGGVVMALAGAFLCAGAKTVLSSLWHVDDKASSRLMTIFYQEWNKHNNVAAALQTAQRSLRSEGYKHPFFWATFQAISR